MLGSACFQQGFRPAVGQYRGNKDCRGYAVKIILKSIPAECIRNLELWIYRRIGCISVGFVIIAYCHYAVIAAPQGVVVVAVEGEEAVKAIVK